jgi:hypothetical protein
MTVTSAKIAKAKSTSKVKAKAKTEATGRTGKKQQGTERRGAAATTATTPLSASALTSGSASASTFTPIPDSTPGVPELEQPKARPTKHRRRIAELDSTSAEDQQQGKGMEEQPAEGTEPARKRRKRTVNPSPSPTICRGVGVGVKVEEAGGGDEHPTSQGRSGVRRSTRVTRASAALAATQPVPALVQRGQATKGKKVKARS